ncbi:MAG: 2-amino-4-hydroxy-6-hydroxymethyldihydropteridine diphosphokinase [Gammaproteobacteria bacterium]|nr:2-amino-4-hydroxy-6-hydroxymethyldihydropteridine diphosphokinase [Gammaproteobacteria bacterium]
MVKVFVGVGSNIDRARNIEAGIRALGDAFGTLTMSSTYESEAVGFRGDNFFNLVVVFESKAPPEHVAATLRAIEQRFGRDRGGPSLAPRTLDLDLLLYNELVRNDAEIRVPREDLTRYAFVLRPLAEIAPQLRHPVTGQRFADIWAAFDQSSQKLWPAPVTQTALR